MPNSYQILLSVMKKELNIYKEMLELYKVKKDILIKGDVKALSDISLKEDSLIWQIKKHENRRIGLMKNLNEKLGKIDNNFTFLKIIDFMDDDNKKQGKELRAEFLNILEEINKYCEQNAMLLKHSLDYFNYSMKLMLLGRKKELSYGKIGEVTKDNTQVNLVNHTI